MKRIKGFTMIELLIVIAVLGVLAVAVLSAINPIEQINRGKDTGSRSDAEQLLSAIDRYYATKGFYPWQNSADDLNAYIGWINMKIANATGLLGNLSNATSELKTSFVTRIVSTGSKALFIFNNGESGESTYVCFFPSSGAFQTEAANRCSAIPPDLSPVSGTICGGASNSYSCLP